MNLRERVFEVHRGPSGEAWASITRHGAGEILHLERFPDVAVAVDAVLPPG